MTYDHFFSAALTRLKDERRYRVFADLERIAGRFPYESGIRPPGVATSSSGARTIILAWASTPR
jgi:hypothetical protein